MTFSRADCRRRRRWAADGRYRRANVVATPVLAYVRQQRL